MASHCWPYTSVHSRIRIVFSIIIVVVVVVVVTLSFQALLARLLLVCSSARLLVSSSARLLVCSSARLQPHACRHHCLSAPCLRNKASHGVLCSHRHPTLWRLTGARCLSLRRAGRRVKELCDLARCVGLPGPCSKYGMRLPLLALITSDLF